MSYREGDDTMMRTRLLFAVLLAAIASGAAADTVSVTWTNARQVSLSRGSLSKSSGGAAWNSGASATQALLSGAGYFEFTATAADKLVSAGLSETDLSLDPFDPAGDGGQLDESGGGSQAGLRGVTYKLIDRRPRRRGPGDFRHAIKPRSVSVFSFASLNERSAGEIV
jgi:hypothetical protein